MGFCSPSLERFFLKFVTNSIVKTIQKLRLSILSSRYVSYNCCNFESFGIKFMHQLMNPNDKMSAQSGTNMSVHFF